MQKKWELSEEEQRKLNDIIIDSNLKKIVLESDIATLSVEDIKKILLEKESLLKENFEDHCYLVIHPESREVIGANHKTYVDQYLKLLENGNEYIDIGEIGIILEHLKSELK